MFYFVLWLSSHGCKLWIPSFPFSSSLFPSSCLFCMNSRFSVWGQFDWIFFEEKVAGTSWNVSRVIPCEESNWIFKSLEIRFLEKTPFEPWILWFWSWSFDLLILIFWGYIHDVEVVLCPKFENFWRSFDRFSNSGAFGSFDSVLFQFWNSDGGRSAKTVRSSFLSWGGRSAKTVRSSFLSWVFWTADGPRGQWRTVRMHSELLVWVVFSHSVCFVASALAETTSKQDS
jgi:hypothetical protein